MNSQQLGKFFVPEELVRNNPDIVAKAFSDMQFIAVRTELDFVSKKLEYRGISSSFEEIGIGRISPEYRVDIIVVVTEFEGEEPEYSRVEVTKL